MRRIVIAKPGGYDALQLIESPLFVTQLDMEVYDHRQVPGFSHVHFTVLRWE